MFGDINGELGGVDADDSPLAQPLKEGGPAKEDYSKVH